jgi:hypothetical protein
MHTSPPPHLEPTHDLIIYSQFVQAERKKILLCLVTSLFFVVGGFWMIMAGRGENVLNGWVMVLFFGLGLLVFPIQLTWGPLLVLNEQTIRIRSNPFLKSITLSWQEIAAITLFKGTHSDALGITLSPAHLEAFLQRQPPLTRSILKRRLNRFHLVALLPARLFPCSLRALFVSIQERYQAPIQQHHIALETYIVPL